MVKSKILEPTKKSCFGTKEWSENSGICNGCVLKIECGKSSQKKNNP
ncbi:hypothetical protein J4481_01445 [Candidatus Pacearchaeota archaeon]|nr:hypothetical protein [Candidatus Pacearchaeota archaeon]